MNFTKTPLSVTDLAIAVSQITIGMMAEPDQFELVVSEREESAGTYCADLMPHFVALAHAVNVVSADLDCIDFDKDELIYQAFGKNLIVERAGDVVENFAPLNHVADNLRSALVNCTSLQMLEREVFVNVFKNAYLKALPCSFEQLPTWEAINQYAPFRLDEYDATITPLAFNLETICGYQLSEEQEAKAREEFDHLEGEDFENNEFFEHNGELYSMDSFLRCAHPFGTVGAYGESAFSSLVICFDTDNETIHLFQETC